MKDHLLEEQHMFHKAANTKKKKKKKVNEASKAH